MPTYTYLKTFHINNAGIERIAKGPECRVMVREVAEKAMAHAISISPHGSGDYRRAFRVKVHIRRDWPLSRPNPRACADLVNLDPGAIAIEKGSVRTGRFGQKVTVRGHYVLTRTLAHLAATKAGNSRLPPP